MKQTFDKHTKFLFNSYIFRYVPIYIEITQVRRIAKVLLYFKFKQV